MTLEEVFAAVLELDPAEITDATAQATTPTWTSMQHLRLVSALEDEYGVSLTTDEILRMRAVSDARGFLRAKGAGV